ncbi:sugar-binding domain-containing protein [Arcanobacterium phocae]|uniref:sugar-binding domain-containing protein n=1 Tax=Arcanobacterium phocae TaxID=131112 RepID=UPI001C0EC158|nr:sugar-binding domain-containing protein [Arcanobacterium phocae]
MRTKQANNWRKGAIASTLVLALSTFGSLPIASASQDYSRLSTSTQMASDAEDVYTTPLDASVRIQQFNTGWKFKLGEEKGAESPEYSDAQWRILDLPHDYSIEQEFTQQGEAESGYLLGGIGWYRKNLPLDQKFVGKRINLNFDGVYMDATIYVNGTEVANHPYGYTPFSVDITDYVKIGANNVVAVKVNHELPSSRWYSGSGIYRNVDLVVTNPVHIAHDGVTVVAPNIATATEGDLDINATARVVNESAEPAEVMVTHVLTSLDGKQTLGESSAQKLMIAPGSEADETAAITAHNIKMWSVDNPQRYQVVTKISDVDNTPLDEVTVKTGFRNAQFDADNGFTLNGQRMKLKGVSMHHDQGALGARAYRAAIERQIDILKEMGANAIRVTHNPASRDLIDLADEKGMLIVEELFDGFHHPKNRNYNDYARFFEKPVPLNTALENVAPESTWAQFDLEATIRRDINAPSVIMWSLGNEIGEGTGLYTLMENYTSQQADLIKWTQQIDKTRPVTRGDNQLKDGAPGAATLMESLAKADGTVGLNYVAGNKYNSIHSQHPDWKLYGSETASSVNSRGIYNRTHDSGRTADKQLTSYDGSKVGWGAYASEAWYDVITRDYVAGEFVWTGFDYIGEPTFWFGDSPGAVGSWPSPKNSYFGIIDTAGFPKDSYYLYQSQWNDNLHTLHILPAWNRNVVANSQGKVKVDVYSDAPRVELFFIDTHGQKKSLGEKKFTVKKTEAGYRYQLYEGTDKKRVDHENLYFTWEVPYADGTLEAVAKDKDGQIISDTHGRNKVTTAGPAQSLKVNVNRNSIAADGSDLAYVDVTVTDAKGEPVPDANTPITFSIEGNGEIVGTDNGEQADHTSYQSLERRAFSGKALAIAKSTKKAGSFTVTASAEGMTPQSVTVITTNDNTDPSSESGADHYRYPRNIYVKTGHKPILPEVIESYDADNRSSTTKVTWDDITAKQYGKAGHFVVSGKTGVGDKVDIDIIMIDGVGAVLNYSATSPVGTVAQLPFTRPVVMPDGAILSTSFPVAWDTPETSVWDKPGTVTVHGATTIFDQKYEVTATIRVQEPTVAVGDNLAGAAKSLTQSIDPALQSDTLEAIRDSKTAVPSHDGNGPNKNVWTNYENTQKTDEKFADLVFAYDTPQQFSQFEVWFYRDGWSANYPEPHSTRFFVRDTVNEEWKLVETRETIGDEQGNVQPYKYELDPVTTTYLKVEVHNNVNGKTARPNIKPVTGISEIFLKGVKQSYDVHSTALLTKVVLNDEELSKEALDSWSYTSPAAKPQMLEAYSEDNAAVTIVPEFERVSRILVESEDHQTTKMFEIKYTGNLEPDPQPAPEPAPEPDPQPDPQPEPGPSKPDGMSIPWIKILDAVLTGPTYADSSVIAADIANGKVKLDGQYTVEQGKSVDVDFSGLKSEMPARIFFYSEPTLLGTEVSDSQGMIKSYTVHIPETVSPGEHYAVATSNIAGEQPSSVVKITVLKKNGTNGGTVSAQSSSRLAKTGVDVGVTGLLVILLAGLIATYVGKRRRI